MIARIAAFLRNRFHRTRVERDLDDEVRTYLDLLTADKMRAGLPPDAARREARSVSRVSPAQVAAWSRSPEDCARRVMLTISSFGPGHAALLGAAHRLRWPPPFARARRFLYVQSRCADR